MISALRLAWSRGELHRIKENAQVDRCSSALMAKDWVIHTKPHLNEPETMVRYLARDPNQRNFLPIVPGWNYLVRLYRPRKEIVNGTWTCRNPEPVE